MATFLFSFALILASIAALAVGVIVRQRPLAGGCGGTAEDGHSACACGRSDTCGSQP